MPFPNPRSLIVGYLKEHLSVPVVTRVPIKRPDAFVRVVHVGGAGRLNPAIEDVRLVVESWDKNEVAAETRANEVRELLAAMNGWKGHPVYLYREAGPPVWQDDTTEIPIFSFTFTVRLRNTSA